MTASLGGAAFAAGMARAQSAAPLPAAADQPVPAPFGFEEVARLAADLARGAYAAPNATLAAPFADLGYDAYRGIRFRRDADPWAALDGWGLDLLPPGMLYSDPVRINLVENGIVRPVPFDPSVFDFDPNAFPPDAAAMPPGDMGWSGFRLRSLLNRPGYLDEVAVFQGASYFRALGRGNRYGLSARGLALGTGSAAGEEFPAFREFWVHTPDAVTGSVTINALLDSPSVAGAYEFIVTPGTETLIATRAALIPRRDLTDVGIAPLTSMFWFGGADRGTADDYRPAVHDSDGLQMLTGRGERLWRTLNNPAALQISAFADAAPKGFGLIQRARDFADFEDAEANYELRPSAWIAPQGNWDQGNVVLVEIPLSSEFHDNIVTYWQPGQPLAAGIRADFAYRLSFGLDVGDDFPVSRVIQTRTGAAVNAKDARSFFIDFDLTPFDGQPDPLPIVTASDGKLAHPYVLRLPAEGIMRLGFQFTAGGADLAELSARLDGPNGPQSETWLYRWTKG